MSSELPAANQIKNRMARPKLGWRVFVGIVLAGIATSFVLTFNDEMSYWYLASAQNHIVAGEFPQALARVDQAQRWTPQTALPWLVRTQALYEDRQYETALSAVESGLKIEPHNAELRQYRTWLWLELKKERRLIDQLVPPEKIATSDVLERTELADEFIQRGTPELAVEVLAPLKGHALETARARVLLCQALRAAKRYEEALLECEASMPLSTRTFDFFDEALQNLLLLKRYEEAIEKIHAREFALVKANGELSAIERNQFAYFRGVANRELNTAEEFARAAVQQTESKAGGILDTLAYVLFRRGKAEEALPIMNQAIELTKKEQPNWQQLKRLAPQYLPPPLFRKLQSTEEKNRAILYYHRALIWEALGKAESAAEDLIRVQELGQTPGEELF